MALIKCPECGKEISDKAGQCPHCGYPIDQVTIPENEIIGQNGIQEQQNNIVEQKPQKKISKNSIIIIGAIIGIIIIGVIAYLIVTADSREYDNAQKLYASEEYEDALTKFKELGTYEDSAEMVEKCEYALSTDGQFLNTLRKSLMARWDLPEDGKTEEEIYEDNTAIELEMLSGFYDEKFNDDTLGEYARQYIDLLNEAMDSLKNYTVDYNTFYYDWNSIYGQRTMLIKKIVEEYNLTFDEQYQETLDGILKDASGAEEQEKMKQDIQNMISNFVLTHTTDEWDYTTYKLSMENTTEYTFDYFYVDINALDAEGNIIATGNASQVTNWTPGQKAEVDAWVNIDDPDRIVSTSCTAHYQSGNYYE